jgi:hypothetical protein
MKRMVSDSPSGQWASVPSYGSEGHFTGCESRFAAS